MSTIEVHRHATHAGIAVITAISLLGSLAAAPNNAQAPTSTAAKPAATPAAKTAPPVDGGWPRASTTASGASLVVYQPQISSWQDQKDVVLYAAVSYTPKGAQKAALGTVKAESATSVATDDRLVSFSEFRITESNFATLQRDQVRVLLDELTAAVPLTERVIALDRVLANMDKSQIIPRNVEGVKADPPTIFFSKTPAVLVNVDGEPIWNPIQGNDLQYAVNTNWDLFQHTPTQTLYLRATDTWLKASALQGPWTYAGLLPDSFLKLPNDPNWNAVKGALPGKRIAPSDAPKVFATTMPAELILLRGEPTYAPITGTTSLLWISNTDSDLFRVTRTGPVYFLIAGRWFLAPDFGGPWTFASLTLPDDFKKIPLGHPRSRVLASVPGTPEAAEAVLLAQIPQSATVNKDLKAPDVAYQGTPEFQPIEKTTVERAVNTDKDIIKVGDLYYMCFQGVWFMSKGPTGPWEVTGDVPKAIYEIPVSSPAYSVTYVTVQSSTPTTVVYVASAAYTGMMVAWGCAVWGTGYYYPPYVYRGAFPVYYPHYPTYGYAAAYNPWTGAYTRGAVAYGPYGGAGAAARYNPTTGVYSRGAVAYGPYGAAGAAQAYNPRTGAYGATRQGSNVYGSWGSSSVQRGDQWANTQRTTNYSTGVTTRTTQSSAGSSARVTGPAGNTSAVARSNSGDLYAGHDGNVYKNDNGSWQKYNNGGWNTVQQPTQAQRQQAQAQVSSRASEAGINSTTMSQLQSDRSARTEGTQRTNSFSSMRSSGAWGSGSYRGGFGGRRR
jgi:hypothetical protein